MEIKILLFTSLLLLINSLSYAKEDLNKHSTIDLNSTIKQGIQYLEEGKGLFNKELLLKSHSIFDDLVKKDANNYLYHYYLANVNAELVNIYDEEDKEDKAKECIEVAIKYIKKSIELNDKYSDSHCLLADLYGRKIEHEGIFIGMIYGPRIEKEYKIALTLDPKNPNVYLGIGVKYLHTPRIFGGNIDKAIENFQRAISLKQDFVRAYIWLGIAYKKKGDINKARQHLQEALIISPNNKWIKVELEKIAK